MSSGRTAVFLLGLLLASSRSAVAQMIAPAPAPGAELPLKLAPRPTSPAISAADLMTRLYIFADDSMMGRQVGTEYNLKGTAYIEREVRRLGLVPAGEDGGYFQNIPLFNYTTDSASMMSLGDETLWAGMDFMVFAQAERRIPLEGKPVVYGGSAADPGSWISADAAAGKIVVLSVPRTSNPVRLFSGVSRFGRAGAILIATFDRLPMTLQRALAKRTALRPDDAPPVGPPSVFVSPRFASSLFGTALDSVAAGAAGRPLAGTIITHETQGPGRNVIAVLPGADRQLKGEYVAIGAHNDHIGLRRGEPVDHDSLRAFNMVARPQGEDSPNPIRLSDLQLARIRGLTDSLHKLHGVRRDSINNGADDDGSGSVSVLEIAEAFATAPTKPRRSVLFIWHTGEEAGLYGSHHFTDHPTVPRDSIVAELNLDMVGRGRASDVTGETKDGELTHGGPGYLQLVGSRRLSTELGDLIEQVNRDGKLGFTFDYSMDANGHPMNIYCRSDHYEYARYGIPIAFFTTGGHSDYHQVTDEPQYIDYDRMAQVATLVHDAAWKIANLDHRVVVDKPKPDPNGQCVQ
jgi:Peptidase family M28